MNLVNWKIGNNINKKYSIQERKFLIKFFAWNAKKSTFIFARY